MLCLSRFYANNIPGLPQLQDLPLHEEIEGKIAENSKEEANISSW